MRGSLTFIPHPSYFLLPPSSFALRPPLWSGFRLYLFTFAFPEGIIAADKVSSFQIEEGLGRRSVERRGPHGRLPPLRRARGRGRGALYDVRHGRRADARRRAARATPQARRPRDPPLPA